MDFNLKGIFKIINVFFRGREDRTHEYYGPLACNWINSKSLSELIKFKIYNLKKNGEPTQKILNHEIEKLFGDINNMVRFEYQKYLKCYIDILLHYYQECNYDPKRICESLPIYLEYGTFKKNIILLQSVGFSRATSIQIDSYARAEFTDENDCLEWLRLNKDHLRQNLSPLLWIEVQDVV